MSKTIIGYARCSTDEQNPTARHSQLREQHRALFGGAAAGVAVLRAVSVRA